MLLSMLTFQTDEFLEGALGRNFSGGFGLVRELIEELFDVTSHSTDGSSREYTRELDSDKEPLKRFTRRVLQHPAVVRSSGILQARLAAELKTYLLAHVVQARDNRLFSRQQAPSSHSLCYNGCLKRYSKDTSAAEQSEASMIYTQSRQNYY